MKSLSMRPLRSIRKNLDIFSADFRIKSDQLLERTAMEIIQAVRDAPASLKDMRVAATLKFATGRNLQASTKRGGGQGRLMRFVRFLMVIDCRSIRLQWDRSRTPKRIGPADHAV